MAWWADGTEEKDATVAEGITSASYLLKELEAGTEYHAKVKACRYNNPGYDSDYSAVVSQKTDIAPVQAGIVVSKVLATSSTLTVEWARADGQACVNSSAQVYHVKLYSDAECKDLFVGWNASNVFGITAGNRFRFTFSGLAPPRPTTSAWTTRPTISSPTRSHMRLPPRGRRRVPPLPARQRRATSSWRKISPR